MTDDKTAVYVQAVYPCFEDLKQAVAQLAGLLLLNHNDPQLRRSAEEACKRAVDGLGVAAPSQARQHHQHLRDAAARIGEALRTPYDPLPFLKLADVHLRAASQLLPGFEMIDFGNACCSAQTYRWPPR